jgi:2-polyprenyl-3-methyl-5-hydroxy-6-metoxy-1,4-benzoquinol methylase
MVSKYDTSVDLSNKNNSHTLIVGSVGRGKRVLDVGASTGFLAEVLTGRGCSVTGIEIDPDAARQAEEFCERVIVGNVEELDLDAEIGAETFDVLVFGDVLEHLKDPQRALERFKPFLDPGGHVVASIPNIAHGSVRLALLQGKFRYRPLGLLDNTHLRFFTRESVEEMFGAAGFLISEVKRTRLDVFDTEIDVDAAEVPEEIVRLVRSDPEAFTYQFVLTAHPTGRAGTAEVLVHELAGKLRGLEDLRLMLDLRDRQLAEREREVERLTQEVSDLSGRLATLVQQGKADA